MDDKIISLLFEKEIKIFNLTFENIREYFKSNSGFEKQLNYLQDQYSFKEKWADAFRPKIFSAGTHTTSRAESVNSAIKKYLNSRSEISTMITLIDDLEKSYLLAEPDRT